MKAPVLFASFILSSVVALGQQRFDDLHELIGKMITDEEANAILYKYDHYGDGVLFMAYNDAVKNAMDTSRYAHLEDWKYYIMMDFSGNRVYLAGYGFLLAELIRFYLQFDEINISEAKARIKFRTSTMGDRVEGLDYFEGEIFFRKKGNDWYIERKRIRRI